MAAVVCSALKRAAGVHCVTCAGLAKASLSQRSNVDSLTPVCSETCCKLALCGGSNFATTLSLKACPYRATCFLYCLRPCSFDFYRGDNYSDSGGGVQFTIIDHERALGIQPMQLNRLALFATNQFQPQLVAGVQSASTSAALAQQALLGVGSTVWQMIAAEFASVPSDIGQHCSTFSALAQANLGSLASNTANAMTPMFARQKP